MQLFKLTGTVSTTLHNVPACGRLLQASWRIAKAGTLLVSAIVLSGCLITSPYYGQKFNTRSAIIPFTVQHPNDTPGAPVELQCGKAAAYGGLKDGESWTTFATLPVSSVPTYAPDSTATYVASGRHPVPDECWRYYNYSDQHDYITVVRVKVAGNTDFRVFDEAGLVCLGEAIGSAASFSAWSGCEKRYTNVDQPIRNLFLKAKY